MIIFKFESTGVKQVYNVFKKQRTQTKNSEKYFAAGWMLFVAQRKKYQYWFIGFVGQFFG